VKVKYSKVIDGPAAEIMSLSEAKLHLKVDGTDEDALITLLIQASREMVEEFCNRSLITQQREIRLDYFPNCPGIELTYGVVQGGADGDDPVEGEVEITYSDENDDPQTFSTDDYWLDSTSDIARIVTKDSWPQTYYKPNAVSIKYWAGYGDTSVDVPGALIAAAKLILAHLYENRQEVSVGSLEQIPFGAYTLMNPYRIFQDATV
jgi:uncharacterized phiE125 gp8 family phage protein